MKAFHHPTELALFAMVIAGPAGAQVATHSFGVDQAIERWSKEKGVVVTKEVRERLARDSAVKFVTGAPEAGFKTSDAWQLGSVIAGGGTVKSSPGGEWGRLEGRSSAGDVVASVWMSDPRQHDFLRGTTGVEKISSLLTTYPTLHLVVQPVPPRDYSVKINGQAYSATEKALYGVAPGSVRVRIERDGKPPCEWSGMVSEGQAQTIACKL
jgi:hypothetical protein